jgi:hypothetical protein
MCIDDSEDDDMRDFEVPSRDNLKDGTYVLVQYLSKKSVAHFAGITVGGLTEDGTLEVKFLKRQPLKVDGYGRHCYSPATASVDW